MRFLALVFLVAATACGDGTGVDARLQGMYGLRSVNGQRLPYRYSTNSAGGYERILSGSIEVTATQAILGQTTESAASTGESSTVFTGFGAYLYERRDDRLILFTETATVAAAEFEIEPGLLRRRYETIDELGVTRTFVYVYRK